MKDLFNLIVGFLQERGRFISNRLLSHFLKEDEYFIKEVEFLRIHIDDSDDELEAVSTVIVTVGLNDKSKLKKERIYNRLSDFNEVSNISMNKYLFFTLQIKL